MYTASDEYQYRVTILKSIRFVRSASIIANIVQTLCLGAFAMSFNVEILPIFYSISCTIMTLTFIRNRIFVQRHCCRMCMWLCIRHDTALLAASMSEDDPKDHESAPEMKRSVDIDVVIERATRFPTHFEDEEEKVLDSGLAGANPQMNPAAAAGAATAAATAGMTRMSADSDHLRTQSELKLLHTLGVTTPNAPRASMSMSAFRMTRLGRNAQLGTRSDMTHQDGRLAPKLQGLEAARSCVSLPVVGRSMQS